MLGSQVLFDGQRVIGASLDSWVVGAYHDLSASYHPFDDQSHPASKGFMSAFEDGLVTYRYLRRDQHQVAGPDIHRVQPEVRAPETDSQDLAKRPLCSHQQSVPRINVTPLQNSLLKSRDYTDRSLAPIFPFPRDFHLSNTAFPPPSLAFDLIPSI